jgi:UDP:flavonoid glycosyltransferase YjiC (YdhE family)
MWDQPIPGQTFLTMREFQPILSGEASRGRFEARIRSARAGQCVLFSSFHELEAGVMDSLVSEPSSPRMYSIGPCIPYTTLEEEPRDEHSYWDWLDTQPAGSVLYVSLGSFHSLPPSQLAELAMGLVASGVKFLWALHDQAHSQVRPLLGGNGDGVLVAWCDQLKVLCHPSVGGFLTHCGMNSALEAVFAGVPMLTLPIGMDQPTNSRLIVDVWKIGYSLKEEMQPDGIITREAIAWAVKTLMSSSDLPESNGVRSRALVWRDASRKAIQDGESSSTDLNSFLSSI